MSVLGDNAAMTPEKFIALWRDNPLSERAGAQGHFDDLCELLGVDKPRDPDNYCFERGAGKASGGDGWADVWKRGCFGWENKRPGRDLRAALKQLTDYALELESPPLLVVSDRERIEIHTAFTGYPDEPRRIAIADIGAPENLQTLRWAFTEPEKLRPVKSLAAITEEAAGKFGQLAETLRGRGLEAPHFPQQVAHFLIQCLFCMFAEDEGLLPRGLFTGLLTKAAADPARAANRLTALFAAMRDGGDYGDETIAWFNGGLFHTVAVPDLTREDVAALQHAAAMDWRNIDPSIFGTLFERGLNPAKRSQLGAHYTDPGDHHAPRRARDRAPARRRMAGGEGQDRRADGQVEEAGRQGLEGRRRAVPAPPRTPAQLPRARSRLRQRQLPLPRAQGAQGP